MSRERAEQVRALVLAGREAVGLRVLEGAVVTDDHVADVVVAREIERRHEALQRERPRAINALGVERAADEAAGLSRCASPTAQRKRPGAARIAASVGVARVERRGERGARPAPRRLREQRVGEAVAGERAVRRAVVVGCETTKTSAKRSPT